MIEFSNKIQRSTVSYYPALDGLRRCAIILVILYHNFNFAHVFEMAWVGVDLFFVLSGFLITEILLRKKTSENFIRNFYMRRVLRILPIYYISLIFYLFILPQIISYSSQLQYYLLNQQWFWLYMQNWLFILKDPGKNIFLDHYWSLAVEEQYYLLWPWIILLVKIPLRLITLLLSILLVLLSIRIGVWLIHLNNISYINLYKFTRIDSLCIGSMLAIFYIHGHSIIKSFDKILIWFLAIFILLVLPLIKVFFNWHLPYFACCMYPLIAVFCGWVVYSSLNDQTLLFKIFNTRYLKFFGKISYGLYIFHWPVYWLFNLNTTTWFHVHFSFFNARLLVSLVSTAIAITLAVISYYCIEIHFLKLKKLFV